MKWICIGREWREVHRQRGGSGGHQHNVHCNKHGQLQRHHEGDAIPPCQFFSCILPSDVQPWDSSPSEGCQEASAHAGDLSGARPKPFMGVAM
jgi:hypothetical protein